MQKHNFARAVVLTAALALGGAGLSGEARACDATVSADITVDTTIGGVGVDVCLSKPIFVKTDPGSPTPGNRKVRLTILPGTIIRGQPRTAAIAPGVTTGTPGALIVTRSGELVADGTSTSPIIMTTAAVDNNNDGNPDGRGVACSACFTPWTGGSTFLDEDPVNLPTAPLDRSGLSNVSLWGGVVILGRAPNNVGTGCGTGLGTCTIEGLTVPGFPVADVTHGGILANDSSGFLDFVSVRHAGDEIGANNELNGITMGSVGANTVFQNIEVYANFDDGIEWFGGTVNGRNLHVAFVGDDATDLDEGYTGKNQFVFVAHPFFTAAGGPYGSASGDKLGEWDGDDFAETVGVNQEADGTCRAFPGSEFWNLTGIGKSAVTNQCLPPGAAYTAAPNSRGIQMRNGFSGSILNSIVVNTTPSLALDIDSATGLACPGWDATHNVNGTNPLGLRLVSSVASTYDDTGAFAADELTTNANGERPINLRAVASPGGANQVNPATTFNLVNEDLTFDPKGNASGKLVPSLKTTGCTGSNTGAIDPRPIPGSAPPNVAGAQPGGPFATTTTRGAFATNQTGLFTGDWTVLGSSGLLVNP
jgi:hypothetical protein